MQSMGKQNAARAVVGGNYGDIGIGQQRIHAAGVLGDVLAHLGNLARRVLAEYAFL
jgi:hypothetical protein